MRWLPWAWQPSLRCVVSDAGGNKDMRNAEGQIVGLHGSMAIYISATILLFLLEYSLLRTSYNTELACHLYLTRSRALHSAIPPLLLTAIGYLLCAAIGYLLQQTLSSRAHYTTNVFERWQQTSDRFNFRIGQTFFELVWTTKDKRFSKS